MTVKVDCEDVIVVNIKIAVFCAVIITVFSFVVSYFAALNVKTASFYKECTAVAIVVGTCDYTAAEAVLDCKLCVIVINPEYNTVVCGLRKVSVNLVTVKVDCDDMVVINIKISVICSLFVTIFINAAEHTVTGNPVCTKCYGSGLCKALL